MQTYRCAYQELVELNQLQPNPKNPNKHSAEQIKRLAKIIEYQGQRSPIVVSKRSGLITKGHGRLEALKKLGWERAAVDFQDYDSDEQEYADIVADNAVAEWANLDLASVNMELPDLGPDFDIDLLGIKDFNLDFAEGQLPELTAEEPGFQQVTFVLSNEQKDILDQALEKAQKEEDCSDELNQNKNGNVLTAILKRYVYG